MNATLDEIDGYEVPEYLIERVAENNGYSLDYARMLVREAKRMLYLSVLAPEPTVPSYPVDMAWHEMILFTKWYAKYAEFIGKFIHHIPEKPNTPPRRDIWRKAISALREKWSGALVEVDSLGYAKTKENYEKYLGVKPPKQYWG